MAMRFVPKVLSAKQVAVLKSAGEAVRKGRAEDIDFDQLYDLLGQLPCKRVATADYEISEAAELYRSYYRPQKLWSFKREANPLEALLKSPKLALLLLSHRDGHVRQAALNRLHGPLPGAFFVSLVEWRLNDWVRPVREAAKDCAARCYPQTSAVYLADAMLAVLPVRTHWRRWENLASGLPEMIGRQDVAAALAKRLIAESAGPLTRTMRQALRDPGLEEWLPEIASHAVQPALRAAAYSILIRDETVWPDGVRWEWIDKPMGVRKQVPAMRTRPLSLASDRAKLIRAAANDKALIVQRAALDAVIEFELENELAAEIAHRFPESKSPSIKERVSFILRNNETADRID